MQSNELSEKALIFSFFWFPMNKTLPLLFDLYVTADPVLELGEVGCSFSKMNKASKYETIGQVDSFYSSDR